MPTCGRRCTSPSWTAARWADSAGHFGVCDGLGGELQPSVCAGQGAQTAADHCCTQSPWLPLPVQGASFACINAAVAEEPAGKKEGGEGGEAAAAAAEPAAPAAPKLGAFAFK